MSESQTDKLLRPCPQFDVRTGPPHRRPNWTRTGRRARVRTGCGGRIWPVRNLRSGRTAHSRLDSHRPRDPQSRQPRRTASDLRGRRMAKKTKVIISCAITGAIHTPTMSEHLPITPDEIAKASIDAAGAGASIIHQHGRAAGRERECQDV